MRIIKKCGYEILIKTIADYYTDIVFEGAEYRINKPIEKIEDALSKCFCKEHVLDFIINSLV